MAERSKALNLKFSIRGFKSCPILRSMVKLVDTIDLGSIGASYAGSSPVTLIGSVTQRQSVGLSYQKSWVQIPSGPLSHLVELVDTTDSKSVAFRRVGSSPTVSTIYFLYILNMYLILVKYFYYFYFLKKNKKFKFFVLVDLIFFLMKKYFKLLVLKKKLIKYKNILKKSISKTNISSVIVKMTRQIYLLSKLDLFLKNKLLSFNNFIISFLPTQLLPLGNRKKFYNLINKKFKRFFLLIKKKLNKKFFFFYLVRMFRKIKFLFIKSDAFLNKKNFLFDFFSTLSLESKYDSLLQFYRQHNKKDSFLKNKFLSFFNLIYFFLYRIDFFLFKFLSFFSLSYIRNIIFNVGVFVNKNLIKTTYYFLSKYDLLKLPAFFINAQRKLYIFCMKFYFDFINKYCYKKFNNVKINYYKELYNLIRNLDIKNRFFLTTFFSKNYKQTKINNNKLSSKFKLKENYVELVENIFYFLMKDKKHSSNYNFELLNKYKENYHINYEFPFFSKRKKKDLSFNTNINYFNNINITLVKTKNIDKLNIFNLSYLNNFIHLYFFLSKNKISYYYFNNEKLIISPRLVKHMYNEQKKLFYYFSILYNINVVKLI